MTAGHWLSRLVRTFETHAMKPDGSFYSDEEMHAGVDQYAEMLNDKARLDAVLNLDIDVKPAEGGGWLLIDWRANPPRTTEHATGRAAIDAALLANTKSSATPNNGH